VADFGLSSYEDPAIIPEVTSNIAKRMQTEYYRTLREVGMTESTSITISSAATSSTLSSLSRGGTSTWMAPERLMPKQYKKDSAKATFQSDVFSFGMLIYRVYSGFAPFHELKDIHAVAKIAMGERPLRPPIITDELWLLTTECWSEHPSDRPDIWDIYNRLAVMDVMTS